MLIYLITCLVCLNVAYLCICVRCFTCNCMSMVEKDLAHCQQLTDSYHIQKKMLNMDFLLYHAYNLDLDF